MNRKLLISATVIASLALGSCARKAGGQVAAVVNGDEITLQEINAEVNLTGVSQGADKDAVRQVALQRIIQRRLLGQVAKGEGIDKSAEFMTRKRALDDALLVQMLAAKVNGSIRVPDSVAVDAFMASRPAMFGQRAVLTLDRIAFAAPADAARLAALKGDHSIDAIARRLQEQGIAFTRGSAQLDTAQMAPGALKQIDALPAGEPFVMPQGDMVIAGVVTARRAAPVSGDPARQLAASALRNEQLGKMVEQRFDSAKAKATIEYQAGFTPRQEQAQPASNHAR